MEAHWVKIELKTKITNREIILYNVYSPNHYKDKETCWKSLKETILAEKEDNLILEGDPNLFLKAEEKRGDLFHPDPSQDTLEKFIEK